MNHDNGEISMSELTSGVKTFLLKSARLQIEAGLSEKSFEFPPFNGQMKILKEKRGCFVTLHKNGNLRGCIGTIEPVYPLLEGVCKNALNAAFADPRFSPLSEDELKTVKIEISVLTVPRPLHFQDGNDLERQLTPGVHGVILSQGNTTATFLPQVWEQLPDKKLFLSHLCLKGNMSSDCWKDPRTSVKVYEAEYFSEP
jgi:AmmeMemoRadiSam system protein A